MRLVRCLLNANRSLAPSISHGSARGEREDGMIRRQAKSFIMNATAGFTSGGILYSENGTDSLKPLTMAIAVENQTDHLAKTFFFFKQSAANLNLPFSPPRRPSN